MFAVGSCEVRVPVRPLTGFHLLIDLPRATPDVGGLDPDQAADLTCAYRKARRVLAAGGCDGFNVCLAYRWRPVGDTIGEPEYEGIHPQLHVFGRNRDEDESVFRALSRPVSARRAARPRVYELPATGDTDPVAETDAKNCACCVPSVEREQELWRRDGVRVIRPRKPVVDRNVIVMPLRHVAGPASLTAAEMCSIWNRLAESIDHLGATGLSVFLNDGERAAQHIPHVHIHVFGRSPDEAENPFLALGRR